ncbi:hypothetical protein SAMN04487911_1218 [Arenibacter nanhaiticus]|uniref:DUF748 domain-containing protein n=1 Tax=Arenibacter nanhaiticus TaxID=558155 RepID=A0A1M6J965_9FLAO|nr:hypothetical protein [Arenibacter nanhaiticus]SHJ43239.1 hypothetical protein SAMN04487911_1218 [Arenibacter nanhaiticus]
MAYLKKSTLFLFLGVLSLGVVGNYMVQLYVEKRLGEFLDINTPPHMEIQYQEMEVNLLQGKLRLGDISVAVFSRDSLGLKPSKELTIASFQLNGFNLWEYYYKNTVYIKEVLVDKPELRSYSSADLPKNKSHSDSNNVSSPSISIDNFNIKDGSFIEMERESGTVLTDIENFDLALMKVQTDAAILRNKIPIRYGEVGLEVHKIYAHIGNYEELRLERISLKDKELVFSDMNIRSKYSKQQLSRKLITERDYIDLKIPQIALQEFALEELEGSIWIKSVKGEIKGAQLALFRDKLVNDDLEKKPMYSKMLRELPFKIDVSELLIIDGHIEYEELVNANVKAGRLFFDAVDATVNNLSNTYEPGEKTTIVAKANFMGAGKVNLDWDFDVNNKNDAFIASGAFQNFEVEGINSFLENNLRVQAKGMASEIYFTISGNNTRARSDMKMKYKNFEFVVLKKDGQGINKLITALGNLLLKKGSKSNSDGYRYGAAQTEREETKSFFNYVWINLRDALVTTITGNGKKDRK